MVTGGGSTLNTQIVTPIMSKRPDPDGDKIKAFEAVTDLTLDPTQPVIIRLDGRAFHSWTACVDRPFDPRLNGLMVQTMLSLASASGARYCYTQSDEITLVCLTEGKSQPLFGGRVLKLCSLLASLASVKFNHGLAEWGITSNKLATFDCRAFNVPDKDTAAQVVIWRETDAIRNSTLGRGQEFMSHNEIHGMSAREVRDWLKANNRAWGELPPERKFGVGCTRRTVERPFTATELDKLPEKHAARKDPNLTVHRQEYVPVRLPLKWGCTNPEEVVFDGVDPILVLKDDAYMESIET